VTLFGHASDSTHAALTVTWTQTSGPAAAVLSAPWALTTSISFTSAGVYGFDLTVTNGASTLTSSTTVQVLSATSQTAFYVDPSYTGGSNNGSAAHPWNNVS